VNQLDCHRHQRIILRQLGACMGAPGPHDFAVRADVVRPPTPAAATAFRFTFVTTRTPLVSKRDVLHYTENQNFGKAKYFRSRGLTGRPLCRDELLIEAQARAQHRK
jgi:hypothetical protein